MKHCGTCIHIRRNCDGNCESCRHGVVKDRENVACKCIECFDEESGRYLHYEENKEVTRLL